MGKDGKESQVGALIDAATTSPAEALDVSLLTSLKRLVRASDDNLRLAFVCVMGKLRFEHSQVRYLALLIADELFTRSKLFRTLLVNDLETFMLFSVGYRSNCPLPPPVNRATALRAKSMEILEKWNDSFGLHYKPLRLGYEYLKNTLRLQFPNLRQAAAQAEQQRKEREARSKALVLEKYEILKRDFPGLCAEIQQTLKELDECFEILNAANTSNNLARQQSVGGNDDIAMGDDLEDYGANSLRHALAQAAALASQAPAVPCETQENKPIFDSVRDLCRLIASQHFPAVQDWMSVLIRVHTEDREGHGSLFKRVLDVRNQLSEAKAKCLELGIDIQQHKEEAGEEDGDIVWEEGGIVNEETLELHKAQVLDGISKKEEEEEEAASVLESQKKQHAPSKAPDDNGINIQKMKLLEEAPVLPWGSFLDRWGTEHTVPVNQRGLLLESHWGKVDFDALLPAEKVAEMNMRASYYTAVKTEIRPCLAPLKNGGLCQRRDLRVCPLHGPVRPRDSSGNPISVHEENQADPSSRERKSGGEVSSSVPSESSEFVKEVAAKAVANVRAQEALEASKKKERKLQAKRNREHNVAVLRDAALAYTSQGFSEALDEDLEGYGAVTRGVKQQSKRARSSLKAMLQPKPTAKDRLAQRLLNSRATDATVRVLTRDEDTAYKEAFANQW